MTSTPRLPEAKRKISKNAWTWIMLGSALPIGLLLFVAWWFTEPYDADDLAAVQASRSDSTEARKAEPKPIAPVPREVLSWPKETLEGDAAKRLLLKISLEAEREMSSVAGYRALFHKQERIGGKLHPEETMELKVRHQPFSVYLKFLEPKKNAGKEVVYATGRHEGKVIGHFGGISRRLLPRISVPPDHPIALADTRHPITDAGLANLIQRLLRFRKLDIDDPDATTLLDWETDVDSIRRPRSIHTHSHPDGVRPYTRVEILYDPRTWFPIAITNYDWPKPGETGSLKVAEHYRYDQIELNPGFEDIDFDPANPAYEFHRF